MDTVRAALRIEVLVNCPNCNELIDLLDDRHTNDVNLNDEGQIMSQAVPDGNWVDEHKSFTVSHVTCSECKEDFNVKGLDW
jgi:hypothetical protein